VAEDLKEAHRELQRLVNAMVKYTKDNGLALNGAKTQVMVGGKAKARDTFTINVNGAEVKPSNSFELLGITFNRQFTVQSYLHNLAREARFWAGRVARLAQHLPRGQLLRQLGSGLLMGKLAHCLPVVARLRLPGSMGTIPEALALVQFAMNDVVCCQTQEGGPHHHRGPAGGGKALEAQPAGGPGHGHVSVECLL
jgi:hypothetical protein